MPKLSLKFGLYEDPLLPDAASMESVHNNYLLEIWGRNEGSVYARYVNAWVVVPTYLVPIDTQLKRGETLNVDGEEYVRFGVDNCTRDLMDVQVKATTAKSLFGPSRHEPILPGLSFKLDRIKLRCKRRKNLYEFLEDCRTLSIRWETYADNAPPRRGEYPISEFLKLINRDGSPKEKEGHE